MSVLMKGSDVTEKTADFITIASHKVEEVQAVNHETFAPLMTTCSPIMYMLAGLHEHKKRRCLVLLLMQRPFLACPRARALLPIESCMYDSIHCYYSKGAAALEIALVAGLLKQLCRVSVADRRASVIEVSWCSSVPSVRAKSARGMTVPY